MFTPIGVGAYPSHSPLATQLPSLPYSPSRPRAAHSRRDVCLDNVLVESRAISTPEALQLSVRVLEGMLEKSNAGGAGGAGGSNTGTVSRARGAGGGHRTAELSSRPVRGNARCNWRRGMEYRRTLMLCATAPLACLS